MTITGSTIHLTVHTAAQASPWYQKVFRATEANRIVLPGDKLIHVEMHVGDLTLMLADEFPEMSSFSPKHLGGTYAAIYLHVDDVDVVWERAIAAGASIERPLADVFWGERDGQIIDPFGHRWGLTQHLHDVSIEKMQELATAAFSGEGLHS